MKRIVKLSILALVGFCTAIMAGCGSDEGENVFGIDYIPFQEDDHSDKWGFIDFEGNILLEQDYRNATPFYEGFSLITSKKGYYDFLDKEGNEFDERFYYATPFHNGLAATVNENEGIKYINESNEVVLELLEVDGYMVEEAGMFCDGLAKFKTAEGLWGFCDEKGKAVIEAKYDYVRSFQEGKAVVAMWDEMESIYNYGMIDTKGVQVLPIDEKYEQLRSFSDGMVAFLEDDAWGFMNDQFEVVMKPNDDWSYVTDFFNGYSSFDEDDEWGLIDKSGEKIFRAKYDSPLFVSEGLVAFEEDREWGFMDLQGTEIIEPVYDDVAFPFVNGIAIVKDGRSYVFINKEGNQINENEYENVMGWGGSWINVDQTVYSDFFDAEMIVETLINSFEIGSINGLTQGASLTDVQKIYEDLEVPSEKDIEEDVYSYMYMDQLYLDIEPRALNVEHELSFVFDQSIVDVEYDYWAYQYNYDYNPDIALESFQFSIYYMGAEGKGEKIADALKDRIKEAGFWFDRDESSSGSYYFRESPDDEWVRIGIEFSPYSVDFTYTFEGYYPQGSYYDDYYDDDYYYDYDYDYDYWDQYYQELEESGDW